MEPILEDAELQGAAVANTQGIGERRPQLRGANNSKSMEDGGTGDNTYLSFSNERFC